MNVLSILFGILSLLGAFIAFIPLLGILNWFILPLAFTGLVAGLLAKENSGRNVNIVVIGICIARLTLGGGIF